MAAKGKHQALKWVIWSIAVIFLFYEFILRVFPSVMVEELMGFFKVDAEALGLLSAFYFYAYAPMQLPVGLLMDRFGARKLLTLAAIICALGNFMFAITSHLAIAETGRFFMGIGSAFAFVGMVYVCSHWFLGKKLALLIGLGNSIGMLGAIGGEGPLSYFVDYFGWRATIFGLGIIGLILAAAIYLTIRREPPAFVKKDEQSFTNVNIWKNLKDVCKNYQTWINSLVALFFYATTAAYASLWGVPYLNLYWGLSRELAGFAVSMIFVGWIVGGPLIGHFSDYLNKRVPIIQISTLLCCLLILPIIYLGGMPLYLIFVLHFLLGLFSSAQLLNFSLSVEINPFKSKGTSISLTNMIVAFGSAFVQPFTGFLMDIYNPVPKGNLENYTLADFRFAFTLFPVCFLIAFILTFFLKEQRKTT